MMETSKWFEMKYTKEAQREQERDWPNWKEVCGYIALAVIIYAVFTVGPWLLA